MNPKLTRQWHRLPGKFYALTRTPTPTLAFPTGPVTIAYVYDPLNRLTEANYSDGRFYHYTYDKVGNRLSVTDQYSTISYTYDAANRLTSLDGVPYTYDNNGNLLFDGFNTYTYDAANRLTSVLGPSSSVSYKYNGLGDRLQETTNGSTTTFTMDLNSGLTQALADDTQTYLYGLGRIAQTNATTTEYFLGDALGSVRQLTGPTGAVTLSESYDPYGTVSMSAGTSQTDYGYTNEYQSQEGIYLRARMYVPATGRFLTRDTWSGDANLPMSYNKWVYAYAQPINYLDPSGLSTTNSFFAVFDDEYDQKTNKNAPHWSAQSISAVNSALENIANAYARAYNYISSGNPSVQCLVDANDMPVEVAFILLNSGGMGTLRRIDPATAFFKIHGGKITITWVTYYSPERAWGLGAWSDKIRIYKDAPLDRMSQEFDSSYPLDTLDGGRLGRFITHEMGHVFENAYEKVYDEARPGRNMVASTTKINNRDGFAGNWLQWQWSSDTAAHEIFADMFVGWVYNNWAKKPTDPRSSQSQYNAGTAKSAIMNKNMPSWITDIIEGKK